MGSIRPTARSSSISKGSCSSHKGGCRRNISAVLVLLLLQQLLLLPLVLVLVVVVVVVVVGVAVAVVGV